MLVLVVVEEADSMEDRQDHDSHRGVGSTAAAVQTKC
jgi:hypothetical protein